MEVTHNNMPEAIQFILEKIELMSMQIDTPKEKITEPAKKELLNVHEAAQEFGYSPNSLYVMASKRTIPHIKKGGKLLFSRKTLTEWILEGERKGCTGTNKKITELNKKKLTK